MLNVRSDLDRKLIVEKVEVASNPESIGMICRDINDHIITADGQGTYAPIEVKYFKDVIGTGFLAVNRLGLWST